MVPNWLQNVIAAIMVIVGVSAIPVACTYLVILYGHPGSDRPSPSRWQLYGPPQDHSTTSSNKPDGGERGTPHRPFFVETHHTAQNEEEASQYAAKEFRDAATQWGVLVLTGIVAMATIGLWVATARLWVTTGKLVTSTENTAEHQLRAYVSPSLLPIERFSLAEPVIIPVRIKNVGQTPARGVASHSIIFVGALLLDDDSVMGEPTQQSPLEPRTAITLFHGTETRTTAEANAPLTSDEISGLQSGHARLYLAGGSHYRDIFGRDRTSQFCFYINADSMAELIGSEKGLCPPPKEVRFTVAHIWNSDT